MNRNELLNNITVLINKIKGKTIDKESHDHYLKNHLINLSYTLQQDNNARELLMAGKTFTVFCADSMDWSSTKYKTVIQIGVQASKIAKLELNQRTFGGSGL